MWMCRPVAGTVRSSATTNGPVWSASRRHSAITRLPPECRARTATVTLDSDSSRSWIASESSARDDTFNTGDQLCTSSVNKVPGSLGPAPTTASTARTKSSACDCVTAASLSSCEQLRLRHGKLFIGQGARLVQVGELRDLVKVRRVRTGVCRRRRGVVGLLRLLLIVVLLLLVGLVLLTGVVSHRSGCRPGHEHPTAHTSTRNSH